MFCSELHVNRELTVKRHECRSDASETFGVTLCAISQQPCELPADALSEVKSAFQYSIRGEQKQEYLTRKNVTQPLTKTDGERKTVITVFASTSEGFQKELLMCFKRAVINLYPQTRSEFSSVALHGRISITLCS
ncbi:hypothetical protein JOB18_021464 [Solea senegalensis]|uniref:Uncharacterized protein n=1 Tax=Solea senegalensis TaxID=28829 RepID=A0AAV6S9R0_SOLSE|nr:hypothetical protein JOB18_021464 [Solea senegalensis]